MKLSKLGLFFMAMLLATASFAQRMQMVSGDFNALKDQKNINIVYTYDNMKVGNKTEEEYVTKKVTEYNKDEPGKGDGWKAKWLSAREEKFKPKFEELFNKNLEDKSVKGGNFPDAPYTIILKTVMTEPGWNVGVSRRPASVDYHAVLVKTGTTESLADIFMEGTPGQGGMGYDFDAAFRLQEAYAKAGKSLAKWLEKKVYKD